MFQPADSNYHVKKIVFVGNRGVGKASMIKSYLELKGDHVAAASFSSLALSNLDVDGTEYGFLLFNTAPDDFFLCHRRRSYRDADVILLCYSVDDLLSFLAITTFWYREIQENRPDLPVILVANKIDLREGHPNSTGTYRSYDNGALTARNISANAFVECSAETKEGILDLISAAIRATLT